MKRCRVFYCCFHDVLRKVELPALLGAGLEVIPFIPPKTMIETYKFDPDLVDENQDWKKTLTLPEDLAETIRRIDIYNMCTSDGIDPYHPESGFPGEEASRTLNEHIDVVILSSFPHTVARCLDWFKGITVFRLFGNERESFRILNWYHDSFDIKYINNFYLRRDRYIGSPILTGTLHLEDDLILGKHPQQLRSYIDTQSVHGVTWNHQARKESVVTNISYIHENPNWTEHYLTFEKYFGKLPYRVIGKNNLRSPDSRILPLIEDRKEYLEEMASHSLFISVGQSRQHSQYSPLEAMIMGLPTLFLENSGLAVEFLNHSGKSREELRALGLCLSWEEMAQRAKSLLNDEKGLIYLSQNQCSLATATFSLGKSITEAHALKLKCLELLENLETSIQKSGPRAMLNDLKDCMKRLLFPVRWTRSP